MASRGNCGIGRCVAVGLLAAGVNLQAQTYTGPVFPADNIWNTPVDTLPVDPNSAAYISTIGATRGFHPDFGSGLWDGGPIGIPYTTVPGTQPNVAITFYYPDESDPGPYPIPPNAPIEGGAQSGGDRHILVIDRDRQLLYEVYDAHPQLDGSWQAGSGAIFDLSGNALRPAGWTSADAAGLPIFPGLVRYDEVAAGEIRHAIRFTAPQTRRAYVWPARHHASSLTGAQYPPMGQRFRLKASFDISGFSPPVQVILRAMKRYGIVLADNGSAWYVSGAPDPRWDNDVLHELGRVRGADFEAVDCTSLMVSPDSGQVRGGAVGVAAPQAVGATRGTYDDRVVVTWQSPAGALGVSVWRGLGTDAAGSVAVATGVTTGAFADTAVEAGLTYFYWLKAHYAGATSAFSARVTGYVSAPQAAFNDFDGDGRADEALYQASAGLWRLRLSGGGAGGERHFGGVGMAAAPGDYDGDGRVDLGVYVAASGQWFVRPSTGGADYHVTVAAGAVPVPGDYDGDGRCDMATYRVDEGRWQIWASRAAPPFTGAAFGLGGLGQQAVPADYDGDGRTDAAVFNRLTYAWTILFSGGGSAVQAWGGANTFGVPADYDGDGRADLAVFNRVTGNWLVVDSATGLPRFQAGNRRVVLRPVPGDYDGDEAADFAVYVPARATWFHRRSQDGQIVGPIAWGAAGFEAVTPWR